MYTFVMTTDLPVNKKKVNYFELKHAEKGLSFSECWIEYHSVMSVLTISRFLFIFKNILKQIISRIR